MSEVAFHELAAADRREALHAAQDASGRRAFLLEKDVWVVHTLRVLFDGPFGADIVFKGGTSLAKAYHAIRRFSEDVDVTYDIRALAPDLVRASGEDPLPATRSQEKRWTKSIRSRLVEWVRDEAQTVVVNSLSQWLHADVSVSGDKLVVRYEALLDDAGFVRPEVIIEFGARATGEPHEQRAVACDAAAWLPDVVFPTARPTVMMAERTFWEKATAMHVFCCQQRRRGERLSRHWHDLVRLDEAGYAASALGDRELAVSVARHKAAFFREKDAAGAWIDYERAASGGLRLVPPGAARDALEQDYGRMVDDGMLLDDAEPFGVLMERCADLEARANGDASATKRTVS